MPREITQSDRERLRSIKTFPQLVKYLRDDLDWPIESDDFEDLIFDWDPRELGIDEANAAKIDAIKQLRPLASNQPWGIFFVKFEPKRLPVVALRRILSKLIIRERAHRGDQAAWQLHDLLFISNYGEGEDRQITFAQFTQQDKKDLPALKVLGWDDTDTALHIDHTHHVLKDKLSWRDEYQKDSQAWRSKWSEAFTLKHNEVIATSKELAVKLADLAKRIRKRAKKVLDIETKEGPMRQLHQAFQKVLIHDLKQDDFADMYAQTITYGLLAARMSRQEGIISDHISEMVPVTNPFLKELLETFLNIGGRKAKIDFDELGVQDVVEFLNDPNTKIDAILRDFGNKTRQEDPVIHFYELFLKEYDPEQKVKRGVFYTPQPVVSYIVRSVHELLQTEFKLEDGLASTITWREISAKDKNIKIPEGTSPDSFFVQILDPAVGTGTFLVEVIDVIHRHLSKKWVELGYNEKKRLDSWNEYVPKCLLTRLYGYELMMAPYAVAHMKIGLKLIETGYHFGVGERLRVYLTNALEPATDDKNIGGDWFYALAHEAQAVNAVKRHQRFTIVIGNPPYSGHSSNRDEWITRRVQDYYFVNGLPLGERNPKWLQDDYVKFIRFAQAIISQSPLGVLGYITNHSYSDNPTFRGMRCSLMTTFDKLRFFDLHGNSKKKEKSPNGRSDGNVFDIQQGVAILLASRLSTNHSANCVCHAHLWGSRVEKYSRLTGTSVDTTGFSQLAPTEPFYLFVPQDVNLRSEFELFPSVANIFLINTMGITTGRDQLCVSYNEKEAEAKIEEFVSNVSERDLIIRFGLSNKSGWNIAHARKTMRSQGLSQLCYRTIAYRPFDIRILYLNSAIVGRSRLEVMEHMKNGKNIGLCSTRQVNGNFRHVFCTSLLANDCLVSLESGERTYLFPLWLFPLENQPADFLDEKVTRPNFNSGFIKTFIQKLNLARAGMYGLPKDLTTEDIFHYAYGVFHSPSYRSRYAEFLKIDFPRLPLTSSLELFRSLAKLGGELVALHLMESSKLEKYITKFVGGRNPEVEKVTWSDETVWIDKVKSIGFNGIPENVWNFHIGGYQVCEKWLKDRKGRKLSKDDIEHYQKVVVALNETIRLMTEIDKVIDAHGGWPGAFTSKGGD